MKGLIENRFGLLALVLVALGALYGVAFVSRPAPVPEKAAQQVKVAVESVSMVCPDPGGGRMTAVTPLGGQGTPSGNDGGAATVAPMKGGKPLATLDKVGALWRQNVPVRTRPVTVDGMGAMAAGLEAAQTTQVTSGAQRGLSGVRCVEPGAEAWFIGPGPAAADVTLHLANSDAAPADVAVMIYAGEGPVLSDRGNGLVVKPGEYREVKLRDLAPSPLVMAVQVTTSGGRVAAAIRESLGEGKGVDWLPIAAPPSTRVVVPGIPGLAGQRELYVAAPGERDTVVQVKAVLKDGSYALKNKESVEVPAGSTTTLDLTTGVGGQPGALVLTSDEPIVAGMKMTGTGSMQDVAFTAGAAPIDLGSVVADGGPGKRPGRGGGKQESRLVLSAPFTAATVRIQLLPQHGAPTAPVEVTLPAARSKEIKLTPPPGAGSGFAVHIVPAPGSGPVYGARVLSEETGQGVLLTAQPLALARTWAIVPATVEWPGVVLP
ncbi:DUF5719 family protein [Microtetraspora sp. NBRC 16547]|uniref:DUF5719 family protein n=1 Tax=Microtetraspora sp. NBRC 16547 TaxID=3030993 RepID=UPI0024A23695|nr:DUF5719 family protein [Microtetraspora sp. NBRC 16547]GLW96023.1 hypothetical protein Misp02_01100 [Microtetraspora sp. NBRC 16547]